MVFFQFSVTSSEFEHHVDQHGGEDTNRSQINDPIGPPEVPNHDMMPIFDDPYPMFSGKRFLNDHAYICYFNSIVNGLLSLRNIRELIKFMEPSIKDVFISILEDDLNSLEQMRLKLHELNSDFSFGRHCDPCEAITTLLQLINLDHLYQKSLVKINRHQSCSNCGDKNTYYVDDPFGNPNILKLKLTDENSVQDEVNGYIENFGSNEPITSFCQGCQKPQLMIVKDFLETSDIVIIRILRFHENGTKNSKEVLPNDTIKIGTFTYKLKCFLSHHGNSVKNGHYTSIIPIEKNCYYLYDDSTRTTIRNVSKDPYILFYEKMDPNTPSSSQIPKEVPTFFQEQVDHQEATQKEFIYPTCIYFHFTQRAIMHKDDNGKQMPLLAYIAGYMDSNKLIGTELIFPEQSVNGPNLNDLGNFLNYWLAILSQ